MKNILPAINKINNDKKGAFYLFDIGQLYKWCDVLNEELDNKLSGRARLVYAIKANPFLTVYMNNKVDKFEVCSPGEFEICMKQNIPTSKIVFSGVYKSKENIERIFENGFEGVVTLESVAHFELLREVISEKNITKVRVLPRLSSGNKFGMDEETIINIIRDVALDGRFEIDGIQFFSGTQKKKIKIIADELAYVDSFCEKVKTETGITITNIEYGPGFYYDYYSNENHIEYFTEVIEEIKKYTGRYSFELESGRFMSAGCGNYITSIVDVKKTFDKNYILVDGGIHHVNYYGRMLGMNVPKVSHIKKTEQGYELSNNEKGETYEVTGALCTVNDVLLKGYSLDNPKVDDLLVFHDTGAYSCTESSVLFLSRDIPRVFTLMPTGEVVLLRDRIDSYRINCG